MVRHVGIITTPILAENEKLYLNRAVGYADSARAVDAVSQKVRELGVQVYKKNVTNLIVKGGKCLGVQVDDTDVLAEHMICSVGAWTLMLLRNSHIDFPPKLFSATAVGVATLDLAEEEFDQLKHMPILVTDTGEVMLSHEEKVLKMTTTKTFRLENPDQLPTADIQSNREVLEKMLPQFAGRLLQSFTCPDLLTPNQDPVVDYVPVTQGFIVATGGSYHSYKFLPIFGEMVVSRILKQEPTDPGERALLKRWGWNRPEGGVSVHPNIVPQS